MTEIDALPEIQCPGCGATIRARLADAPPAVGDRLALPQPPLGTRLDIEGCAIERHPDGWGWVDDALTRFDWLAVQRIAATATDPRLTVLRWGGRPEG
jgi:hypothetical protein